MKEVPEEAFGFPEAGDGKAEKLLASAEFPGSIGRRADPNSVRPGTRPIGRYIGRVSG